MSKFLDEVGLAELWALIKENDDELADAGVKIATGSYTGTGTYGKANSITLNFDFTPKLVIVALSNRSEFMRTMLVMVDGATVAPAIEFSAQYNSDYYSIITWGGNSVSWYCNTSDAQYMLNVSGYVYNYFAIG